MSKIDTALIYAAGRGTRMGALTDHTPKPLLKLQNRALIDYAVALVLDAGIQNIHVNAAYLGEQLEAHFKGSAVTIHQEPNGPYETGGTLKSLAELLPEAILTLNSDVLYFGANPIPALIDQWNQRQNKLDALLNLLPRKHAKNHQGQGDFFWQEGALSRRDKAATAPYIYASLQIIRPKTALPIEDKIFSTNQIWDRLIATNRIGAHIYEGGWMDLGNAEALQRAEKELASG